MALDEKRQGYKSKSCAQVKEVFENLKHNINMLLEEL